MTVIAWDGKTLAADKRGSTGGMGTTVSKLVRHEGMLIAGCGAGSDIRRVVHWILNGADVEKWPNPDNDSCEVLVVRLNDGRPQVGVFYNSAHPMICEDKFFAMGEGGSIAMAAMHLGYSAIVGVELACKLCNSCGNGIDTMELVP